MRLRHLLVIVLAFFVAYLIFDDPPMQKNVDGTPSMLPDHRKVQELLAMDALIAVMLLAMMQKPTPSGVGNVAHDVDREYVVDDEDYLDDVPEEGELRQAPPAYWTYDPHSPKRRTRVVNRSAIVLIAAGFLVWLMASMFYSNLVGPPNPTTPSAATTAQK